MSTTHSFPSNVFLIAVFAASAVLSGCGGAASSAFVPSEEEDGGRDRPAPSPTPSPTPGSEAHAVLSWTGDSAVCLACHEAEARDMHGSVHYQWKGVAPLMVNGPTQQGKIAGGMNSYCISITGNWTGCGKCHAGKGAQPQEQATPAQLANIDCLMCHQKGYRRKNVGGAWVPDTDAMTMTMDEALRTVHRPDRDNCLQCHAFAGGGDAVKRGDLAMASAHTSDGNYDVHMSTARGNLKCQDCHAWENHHVTGKGSDLRPSDRIATMNCTDCHAEKGTSSGHGSSDVNRHVARVACQTCHVPIYAKHAADSTATEATETHRTWLETHATAPPYHPAMTKANDLRPAYRWFNGTSDNVLLHDSVAVDPETGRYPTSRPLGAVNDGNSKLHPFKYKTAEQPIVSATGQLLALDTSVFFATADARAASRAGLQNMGLSADTPYEWIETDTFQMLNHQVAPRGAALQCSECHGSTSRMDLQGKLGYAMKGPQSQVCYQCHGREDMKSFEKIHDIHVRDKRVSCAYCHSFDRPERGLRSDY